MVALAALAGSLVGIVAFLVSVLTLVEKVRGIRHREDRRVALWEQQNGLLEAQHAALERIAVAVERLDRAGPG